MDDDCLNITLRSFDPDLDSAMVYSTWRNSAYYSAAVQPIEDNGMYFKWLTQKIKRILKKAKVKIACLEECPSLIVGYVVWTGPHLDWIYVKADYREKGIATLLFPKGIETVTPDLTKVGVVLCNQKKLTVKGDQL